MDGITLSIFFGTALGVVGAWILIAITESKLWKNWISKLDLYIKYTFEPKSEIDREIADEEKEIKFLTEQKAKIDRLEHLKRKKDRLYQEVNDETHTVAVDPMPHMKTLKDKFNKEYEDEMFALSKSDDPEIRKKAIAELKKSNHFLGSMMELDNDRRERLDKELKERREYWEQAYNKAVKEVSDARDLVSTLQVDKVNIENLKADEWYRCKQCGSTKVSSGVKYDDTGIERITVCSECRAVIK